MAYKICLFLLELSVYGSFIWVAQRFFQGENKSSNEIKFIRFGGLVFILSHLVCAAIATPLSIWAAIMGIFLLIASLVTLWLAVKANREQPLKFAFVDNEPTHIVTSGIYSVIRHPFYASYLYGWLGGTLASGYWGLIISFFCMGYVYLKAVRLEEMGFNQSSLSKAYGVYKLKTGMFLPYF